MRVSVAALTDVGRKRDHNEDSFHIDPEVGFYVVCDGMGGHAAGEVASAMAVQITVAHVRQNQHLLRLHDDDPTKYPAICRMLEEAVQRASNEIHTFAINQSGKAGMGTTLTSVLVHGHKGIMAHVGDSRLYLLRSGNVDQLSDDHSYVNEMIKRGLLTAEQASKGTPYANAITRAVGIHPSVQVDTLVFDLLPEDTLMLCSDGLIRHVETNEELGTFLVDADVDGIPKKLIDKANERGGSDNITVITLRASADTTNPHVVARSDETRMKITGLRYINMFQDLNLKEMATILSTMQNKNLRSGEVLMRAGEFDNSLYIVLEGTLRVEIQGREIAALTSGAHFGETALLSMRNRPFTIVAVGPARLLSMSRNDFALLIRREQALGIKLLWSLSKDLNQRYDEISAMPTPPPATNS